MNDLTLQLCQSIHDNLGHAVEIDGEHKQIVVHKPCGDTAKISYKPMNAIEAYLTKDWHRDDEATLYRLLT